MKPILAVLLFSARAGMGLVGSRAVADTFGSGANSFSIDFVTIGNPGNPPDANPNPAGAVPYEYRIGKYEIFEQMIDKANALGRARDHEGHARPRLPGDERLLVRSGEVRQLARYLDRLGTSVQVRRQRQLPTVDADRSRVRPEQSLSQQAWPRTFCRASMSGTRPRTTIRSRACITHIRPAAMLFRTG